MCTYRVDQHLMVLNLQAFNEQNSSYGIYDCENFIESEFDAKNVNTIKSRT